MNHTTDQDDAPGEVLNADAGSSVVLCCEHASARVPQRFGDLGLTAEARASHIASDLGALGLAKALAERLDAALVAGTVSRLVYDCNRPPGAEDAMPAQSEVFDIPGNRDLSDAARDARIAEVYSPFHATLAAVLAARTNPVLVTVHSFTPIYHGTRRDVEIGVLHDADARLADALLADAGRLAPFDVRRNAPYGPEDGVTHTLKEHALAAGHPNVMLEVRNDLIAEASAQADMADRLAPWLAQAIAETEAGACRV